MTVAPLHIDPPAAWMTPEAFAAGGAIDERTAHLLRAHGARCLSMWRDSVNAFAAGRALTGRLIEQHNRQSLDHWCMARAAGFTMVKKVEGTSAQHRKKPQPVASTPVSVRWGRR